MSWIHGWICFLRVLTLTTSLNKQLNFIFCMLMRLLRELCFVLLTGVQHHSSGFIWCQNAHWEPDDEASDHSNAPAKLQSDNRWVVTLSGTSHWYSNLLHFPRERTPQWKHYCPLQSLIPLAWSRSQPRHDGGSYEQQRIRRVEFLLSSNVGPCFAQTCTQTDQKLWCINKIVQTKKQNRAQI